MVSTILRSMLRRGIGVVPTIVVGFWAMTATAASASCAETVSIEQALIQAPTIFVGTVSDIQFDGRVATFAVEDVWRGEVPATVVVTGGASLSALEAAQAQGQDLLTSVDRTYLVGERYLVASHGNEGAVLLDNACSVTQPYQADLDQYRPASAHAPSGAVAPEATENGLTPLAWTGLAIVGGGLTAATVALGLRARRARRSRPASA